MHSCARSVRRKRHLTRALLSTSPHAPSRPATALALGLHIVRRTISQAHQTAHTVGRVDVRSMHGENVEADDVAAPRRNRNRLIEPELLRRKMWRTSVAAFIHRH